MKVFNKTASLVLMVLMLCALFAGCSKDAGTSTIESTDNEGKILVTVTDKSTKKPVVDAKIVIVGMESTYKTGQDGKSPAINLTVNRDFYKKYGSELAQKAPSGCVTVLVSKDGYKDYLVFNKAVYPGYSSNNLNVEMTKLSGKDNEKYTVDYQYPHELWLQELVQYCGSIKDEETGSGENKITINVKDQNSKALQDAYVSIPELGIKAKTDKTGNVVLNAAVSLNTLSIYPVKRDLSEYTIVVTKDDYVPSIIFNATSQEGKDTALNVNLKSSKAKDAGKYTLSCSPYEKDWVDKLISNYEE